MRLARRADAEVDEHREAFLVRKASDYQTSASGAVSGRFSFAMGMGLDRTSGTTGRWISGTNKLAEGIGFDARRYVEGLLSLNR